MGWVLVNGLPEIVEIHGENLYRKTSFHVSLVCVKNILEKRPDAENVILEEFCTFTREYEIAFTEYTGEFRLAQYEERKGLIALCEVSNLKTFSELLSNKLGVEVPIQPTHVTLFTLQPDKGIGLNSFGEMEAKSIKIDPPLGIKDALNIK